MKSKLICIASAILLVFSTPVAAGDDDVEWTNSGQIRLNQRFTGASTPTMVDRNGDGEFAGTTIFHMRGRPGKATAVAFAEFTPLAPGDCSFGPGLRSEPVYQSFVETFSDLSMLFFVTTEGVTCVNPATFEVTAEIKGVIVGGTGRFEGATGSWTVTDDIFPVGEAVTALTGTLTGTIEVPHWYDDEDED